MKFPVVVQLIRNGSIWEPKSGQNFWNAGDVSAPLYENTDFSEIRKLIKKGYLKVVSGSLEEELKVEAKEPKKEPASKPVAEKEDKATKVKKVAGEVKKEAKEPAKKKATTKKKK